MAVAISWHANIKSEIRACVDTCHGDDLDNQKRIWRLILTDFKLNSTLKYDLDAKEATLTES